VTFRSRAALSAVVALTAVLVASPSSGAARDTWTKVSRWCTVQDDRIDEASGISRSTYHRDLVFLHNDSGDKPRFFAVGPQGHTRAAFRVRDVQAVDWEDMASGPGHTLWFGDIGDNAMSRDDISVIRVREPQAPRTHSVRGTVFRFRYADGPHNAEALLVRPHSGRLYVVTKATEGAGVYRAPKNLSTSKVNVLSRIADVPLLVTGGDFAPNGRHLVLRTYHDAYLYSRFGGPARKVSLPDQQQGEAVGFTRSGDAMKVASEGVDQPIWRVAR
jgi:hypothetical protein